MYAFLFDRRSLTWTLLGSAVFCSLLFAAGVLVGLRLQISPVGGETVVDKGQLEGTLNDLRDLLGQDGSILDPAEIDPAEIDGRIPEIPELEVGALEPARRRLPGDILTLDRMAISAASPPVMERIRLGEPLEAKFRAAAAVVEQAVVEQAVVEPILDPHGRFTVQVGTYRSRLNAARRAEAMRERGLEPTVREIELGQRPHFVVRVGRFASLGDAQRIAEHLDADAVVLPVESSASLKGL